MKSLPQSGADMLCELTRLRPQIGLVLGSAFGKVAGSLTDAVSLPFADVPGVSEASVKGHSGRFLVGRLNEVEVLIQDGRLHYYEGYSLAQVTFPIRVMASFGVKKLLLTNAAGAISNRLKVGDFMQITDHINLMGENPLRVDFLTSNERFVDMSDAYSVELGEALIRGASNIGIKLEKGVYLAVSGPSYETPAEIKAFANLGADAVGMSTVAETIVARQCGMDVAGLSLITNAAAGKGSEAITHEEVLAKANQASCVAVELFKCFCGFAG